MEWVYARRLQEDAFDRRAGLANHRSGGENKLYKNEYWQCLEGTEGDRRKKKKTGEKEKQEKKYSKQKKKKKTLKEEEINKGMFC